MVRRLHFTVISLILFMGIHAYSVTPESPFCTQQDPNAKSDTQESSDNLNCHDRCMEEESDTDVCDEECNRIA